MCSSDRYSIRHVDAIELSALVANFQYISPQVARLHKTWSKQDLGIAGGSACRVLPRLE
jgi:hypothetical protein